MLGMQILEKKKENTCCVDILYTNPADTVSILHASDSIHIWLPTCLGNGISTTLCSTAYAIHIMYSYLGIQ